jgi:HTH-type transcriptional regulator/antitoxin MqsA
MKNSICPVCEHGELHSEVKKVSQLVNGSSLPVDNHIHWCDACGLDIATSEDLRNNARAMRAAERLSQGKLTGAQISIIRKRLKITQEVAGRLFGGGPVAFCKYENDDLAPSDAMDNLLWLINEKPSVVCDLAKRNGVDFQSPGDTTAKVDFQSGICFEFVPADIQHGRGMAAAITSAKAASKHSWSSLGTWAARETVAPNQDSFTVSGYA